MGCESVLLINFIYPKINMHSILYQSGYVNEYDSFSAFN